MSEENLTRQEQWTRVFTAASENTRPRGTLCCVTLAVLLHGALFFSPFKMPI